MEHVGLPGPNETFRANRLGWWDAMRRLIKLWSNLTVTLANQPQQSVATLRVLAVHEKKYPSWFEGELVHSTNTARGRVQAEQGSEKTEVQ